MTPPSRRLATCIAAVATTAALAAPATSAAATTCKLSLKAARGMGPTYVTVMKVTGTSCANAVKVTKAFHKCRLAKGKDGRCTKRVLGYRCTDRRPSSERIPTQFTGYVTCKKGGARMTHQYQQNT